MIKRKAEKQAEEDQLRLATETEAKRIQSRASFQRWVDFIRDQGIYWIPGTCDCSLCKP